MKKVAGLAFTAATLLLGSVSAEKFLVSDSEALKPMSLVATNWTLTVPETPTVSLMGTKRQRDYASADGSLSADTTISYNRTITNTTIVNTT